MVTREQFLKDLQEAMGHLHDPAQLRRSPLVSLFGISERLNTYVALQGLLTDAIAALKPRPDVPPDSRAWRIHELLICRYEQELSPPEVAHQLGLSTRHMYREQAAAMESLAEYLWDRYSLGRMSSVGAVPAIESAGPEGAAAGDAGQERPGEESALMAELAWLRDAPCEQPVDLNETLQAVVELVQPLAAQYGTELQVDLQQELPGLAVHPIGLNQVLVNLLTAAVRWSQGGTVAVLVRQAGWDVEVTFSCESPTSPVCAKKDDVRILAATCELAGLCRMGPTVAAPEEPFRARVRLPVYEQVVVLAIDDNADTLRLLEHYTLGSRYRLVSVRDPEQALDLAEALHPQLVVLDVMMPDVDGWRLLGRLRQHPATSNIPVVVCTIMAQEELAITLGAAACLQKPVTQQQFLAALDQQLALMEPGSR